MWWAPGTGPVSRAKLPLAPRVGLCVVLLKATQDIPVAGQQCVLPALLVTGGRGGLARTCGHQCCLASRGVLWASEGEPHTFWF